MQQRTPVARVSARQGLGNRHRCPCRARPAAHPHSSKHPRPSPNTTPPLCTRAWPGLRPQSCARCTAWTWHLTNSSPLAARQAALPFARGGREQAGTDEVASAASTSAAARAGARGCRTQGPRRGGPTAPARHIDRPSARTPRPAAPLSAPNAPPPPRTPCHLPGRGALPGWCGREVCRARLRPRSRQGRVL